MTPEKPPLSTTDAAARLGVKPRTLMRWAQVGRIAAIRLPNNRLRFRAEDVEALLVPTTVKADQ